MSRMGEFTEAYSGFFDLDGRDFDPVITYFGLSQTEVYVYSWVWDLAGARQMCATRTLQGETSRGALFMESRDDGIYIDHDRSELFMMGDRYQREFSANGELRYTGLPFSDVFGFTFSADPYFELILGPARLYERDSGNIELRGKVLGPGTHFYVPWWDEERGVHRGMYKPAVVSKIEGTMFGEPVVGFHMIEHIYLPSGMQYIHNPFFQQSAIALSEFATEYEDGCIEYGRILYAEEGPFRTAIINDGTRQYTCGVIGMKIESDDDGTWSRLEYQLENGETWEFLVIEKNGIVRVGVPPGGEMRAPKGRMSRVGERRKVRPGYYASSELYPERLHQ